MAYEDYIDSIYRRPRKGGKMKKLTKQYVKETLEKTIEEIKGLQESLAQKERDLYESNEQNRILRGEVRRLKEEGDRYRMDLAEVRRKKFPNWNYLYYLCLLPIVAFFVGGLVFLIYAEPVFGMICGSVVSIVGALALADYGMGKLKEKGLL